MNEIHAMRLQMNIQMKTNSANEHTMIIFENMQKNMFSSRLQYFHRTMVSSEFVSEENQSTESHWIPHIGFPSQIPRFNIINIE